MDNSRCRNLPSSVRQVVINGISKAWDTFTDDWLLSKAVSGLVARVWMESGYHSPSVCAVRHDHQPGAAGLVTM